jgi:hypothetical protein
MESLESKVDQLCAAILRVDSENWDVRNKAVLQMTELFLEYEHASPFEIQEAFTSSLFRTLKEPVKLLVSWCLNLSCSLPLIWCDMM